MICTNTKGSRANPYNAPPRVTREARTRACDGRQIAMRNKLFIAAVAIVGMLAMTDASLPFNAPATETMDPTASLDAVKGAIQTSWWWKRWSSECISDVDALAIATANPDLAFVLCPSTDTNVQYLPGYTGTFRVAAKIGNGAAQIFPNVGLNDLASDIGATSWAIQQTPVGISASETYLTNVNVKSSARWFSKPEAAQYLSTVYTDRRFAYQTDGNHILTYFNGAAEMVNQNEVHVWGMPGEELAYPVTLTGVHVQNWNPNEDPRLHANGLRVTLTISEPVDSDTPVSLVVSAAGHTLDTMCPVGTLSYNCQTHGGVGYGVIEATKTHVVITIGTKNLPIKATGTVEVSIGPSLTHASGGSYYTNHAAIATATATFTNTAGNDCANDEIPETTDGTAAGCRMYCPTSNPNTLTSDWQANGVASISGLAWWGKVGLALEVSLRNSGAGGPIPFGTTAGGSVKAFVAGSSEIVEIATGTVFTADMGSRDANGRCQCNAPFGCDTGIECCTTANGCAANDEYCGDPPAPTEADPSAIAIGSVPAALNPAGGNTVTLDVTVAAAVDGATTIYVELEGWAYTTDYTCADGAVCSQHANGVNVIVGANLGSKSFTLNVAANAAGKQVTAHIKVADNAGLTIAGGVDLSSNAVTLTKPVVNALSWTTVSPVSLRQAAIGANSLEFSVGLATQYNFDVTVHITQSNFAYTDFAPVAGISQDGSDFFLTITAGETSRSFTVDYSVRAARTLGLTATQGGNNANLDINSGNALSASINTVIPVVTDVKYNDNSNLNVALAGGSSRSVVVSTTNFEYDQQLVLNFGGVSAADMSAAGLTIGCATDPCASSVTVTIPSGTTSFTYELTFAVSGNARTVTVAAGATAGSDVQAAASTGDSLTTSFGKDDVVGEDGATLPGGDTYKNFRAIGTSGSRKTINVAAGANLRFEANAGGSNTRFEHSTLVIPADATVTFAAGVEISTGAKFNGKVVFEAALDLQNIVGLEFEGDVTFADGTNIKTAAAGGRRLLACGDNPLFTNAAVVLGAGSTISSSNVGTVTSWSSSTATLVAQSGYCADGSFIKLAAGGTGVVSVVQGTYASEPTTDIIPLISEFDTEHIVDLNINGVAISAVGTTFHASHEGMINVAGGNTRLWIESNSFDLGAYLNQVPIRVVTGAPNVALVAVNGNNNAYTTVSIKSNSLAGHCLNYIMSDPDLRADSSQPRCSATVGINIAGASEAAIQTLIDAIIAQGAAEGVQHLCDDLKAERVLNLLNLDLKGNEKDIMIVSDTCSGGCYSVCHAATGSAIDATESYAQYVDLTVEWDVSTSQIKHVVYTNNPAGTSSRFNKIAVSEWDDATAVNFDNGVCDSNAGAAGLPTADTAAGGNFQAFTDAQTNGVTATEWVRDRTDASRSFDQDGASTVVTGLNQYTGMLGLEEIRSCSSTETEQFVSGANGSIQRKLRYFVWVYGIESSGSTDAAGAVTYSTASGGKTVMEWKFTVEVITFSDGFVDTSVVAGAPVVEVLDTEILSLIQPGIHLNEYDVTVYVATQYSQGQQVRLASPYYSAASADSSLPECSGETTAGCTYGFSILAGSFTPACMTSHPFTTNYPHSGWCVQRITLRSDAASLSRVLDHTFSLTFNILTTVNGELASSSDSASVTVSVEDHRTLVDDSALLNPTSLLQHLSLSISKFAEYGQRSCNRGDANADGNDCVFIEGEQAIAVARYPVSGVNSVYSDAPAGIKPGQLNIDIISADACISTGAEVDSTTAFGTGAAQCGAVNPSGSCGCQALIPKRTIPIANTQCGSVQPVCHEFQCVANQCQYGRRHGLECSSNRECNADPNDPSMPYTCVGGSGSGQKCNVVGDCPVSLAYTSCTASSSLSIQDRFLNDISVKQYDITYPNGLCYNQAVGGATNNVKCMYSDNNCGASHPFCQLQEIDSSVSGPATSGGLTDFPIGTVKPAGAMCLGKGANAGNFVQCHRNGDGPWNTADPATEKAIDVCAVPADCSTLDNEVAVGFDINAPFFYSGRSIFFDFRIRASLSQHQTAQRPGGYDAVNAAFAFDLQPSTTSATTSVNSAIGVSGTSVTTIDLYNVTSDRIYVSQPNDPTVELSRDDKDLVLGLSIGVPAAAVVVMIGVAVFGAKAAAAAAATGGALNAGGASGAVGVAGNAAEETMALLESVRTNP